MQGFQATPKVTTPLRRSVVPVVQQDEELGTANRADDKDSTEEAVLERPRDCGCTGCCLASPF